jgi:hypothetical protein
LAIFSLLVFGSILPIWATVDFNAFIPISGNPITPSFKFTKTIAIDYPNGGILKDAFRGKSITVNFTDTTDNNKSIQTLMEQLNTEIATNRKSPATISSLKIDYKVQISGDDNRVSIDYLLKLTPQLTGYVLNKGSSDSTSPSIFDLSWMGFSMKNPVVITSAKYGDLEINFPLNVLKNQTPEAFNILNGTQEASAINVNLIEAAPMLIQPIDQWDHLFDPAYTLSETAGYGYNGTKVAVTAFSSGQSGVYSGSLKVPNVDLDFIADTKYHLSTVERAGSGTVDVEGHAYGVIVCG